MLKYFFLEKKYKDKKQYTNFREIKSNPKTIENILNHLKLN